MQWSSYNLMFNSEALGRFCYNALSNTLIELDRSHYDLLEKFKRGYDPTSIQDNGFLSLLREKHVLVEANEEENLLLDRHYLRQEHSFSTSKLGLTICPTLRCNFRCPYCFESSQQDGRFMSAGTQERLIAWIKEHTNIRVLSVAWYGGEPLLAFDTICSLTERFLSLDLEYDRVTLVTNGYLLDNDKIAKLNDLRIGFIQITLDGPPEVHDTRRVLAGGGPTFTRIMENVESVMNSNYAGVLNIRVNIDKTNIDGFLDLRSELLSRFKGKKLSISPAIVVVTSDQSYDRGRCMDICEWASFNLDLVRRHGMFPSNGLYPRGYMDLPCVAGRHMGFVLGPEGELYKCWDDVGRPDMVVGNIHAKGTITNPALRAQYSTGVDPYQDPECRSCAMLRICGGGCPHKRLLAKYYGRQEIQYCSEYKFHLQDYLENYIDVVRTRDMSQAILQPGKTQAEFPGFRVISPEVAQKPQQKERL